MTEQQKQKIDEKYFDLELGLQEYRKAIMWFTHGNLKAPNRPNKKETQQIIKKLTEKIIHLFKEIEAEIQL